MASSETPPPSIRQGVRIVPPDASVTVEEVLLAVGEQVGYGKLSHASRMNKAVVVFLKDESTVHQLIESGVIVRDSLVQVSPLAVPSTRITVSGVPPFIPNALLENELRRFGKMASGFRTVNLGCKDQKLKHVQSLRRQVFMFLESPTQTLEVSFRVKHGDGLYMVYASSGHMKCFECGDVGHKRSTCPHKQQENGHLLDNEGGSAAPGSARGAAPAGLAPVPAEPAANPALAAEGPGAANRIPVAGDLVVAGPVVLSPVTVAGSSVAVVEANMPECNVETEIIEPIEVEKKQETEAVESVTETQVESTQDRASTSGAAQGEVCSQTSCGDDMDYETESDTASICEVVSRRTDLYSLEEINEFLDETFNKSVKVSDYFVDTDKFIKSVSILKRLVSNDLLDEKKRYRLNKHLAILRKAQKEKTVKRSRR